MQDDRLSVRRLADREGVRVSVAEDAHTDSAAAPLVRVTGPEPHRLTGVLHLPHTVHRSSQTAPHDGHYSTQHNRPRTAHRSLQRMEPAIDSTPATAGHSTARRTQHMPHGTRINLPHAVHQSAQHTCSQSQHTVIQYNLPYAAHSTSCRIQPAVTTAPDFNNLQINQFNHIGR